MALDGILANRRECTLVNLVRFTEVEDEDTGHRSPDWFDLQNDVGAWITERNDEDVIREYGPEAEGRHQILVTLDVARKVGLRRDDGVQVLNGQPQYSGRRFKIVSELTVHGYYFRGLMREMEREDFDVVPPAGQGSGYDAGYSKGYGGPS